MAGKRTIVGDVVREVCGRFPSASTRELASKLASQHPLIFNYETARSAVRHHRGLMKYKKLDDPVPFTPKIEIPASDAKPVLPVAFTPTGRGPVLADIHFRYHDQAAIGVAVDYALENKATDFVLLLGDVLDCYQLSKFSKNPEERKFKQEVAVVQSFLKQLCDHFGAVWFKFGNHEVRYERYIMDHCADLFALDSMRLKHVLDYEGGKEVHLPITFVEANQPIHIGPHLTALHGHEYGAGFVAPVNPARGMFLRATASILSAHAHRSSQHTETDVRGNVISCWSVGCLCDLHPDYAPLNKWQHGFAILNFDGDQFEIENKKIIHGKVY